LTICTEARQAWFADVVAGRNLIEHFLQSAAEFKFEVTAYCLMPDHFHALVNATRVDADFRHFIRIWKQKTSFEWKKRTGHRLWQEGYYERVLRDEDGPLGD
jgi:REP element-mobilizing transposase RayT